MSIRPAACQNPPVSDWRHKLSRPGVALVIVLWVVAAALSLGQRDLWAPDEPKYALVAKEMLASGEFLIPHVNGEPYPDKPPLMFWLIAVASLLTGGVGQVAAVLPSLVAGALALVGIARLTRAVGAEGLSPLLSVGMAAVSFRFMIQSTTGQLDMLLTTCTTWAMLGLVRGIGWNESTPPNRRALIVAFGLMGLGTLTKGPVALILPLGGVVIGSWWTGCLSRCRALLDLRAVLAFFVVLGAWLVPAAIHALRSGNEAWLTNILFKQTAVRYAASWHHDQPVWYFLRVLVTDTFPLSLLLPAAIWGLRERGEETFARARRLMAGAVLFTLVFFSLPAGKRDLYLLPSYPWLAVWLALDMRWRMPRGKSALVLPRLGALVLALLAAGAVPALWRFAPPLAAAEGLAINLMRISLALAAISLLAFALALMPFAGRYLKWLGVSWLALYAALFVDVYPTVDQARSTRRFFESIRDVIRDDAPGGMVEFRAQYGLYAGRLDSAEPGDDAGLERLAARLDGSEPFWVICEQGNLKPLLRRLKSSSCVALRRRVSGDEVIILANPSALKP